MPTAIVTGASRGLGRALAAALADRGWRLVLDARDGAALERAAAELRGRAERSGDERAARGRIVALAGDVADPWHRHALIDAAGDAIDLVVNNASDLGPSPLPPLAELPLDRLEQVLRVNVLAPLAVAQLALPKLVEGARVVNVTSDAAVEPYEGWGGYGSAKAAVEQASRILAAEEPAVRVWWVDPGDLRTRMHQEAFPGEDIGDRPEPATVVPAFLRLLKTRPPSGRIRLTEAEQAVPA